MNVSCYYVEKHHQDDLLSSKLKKKMLQITIKNKEILGGILFSPSAYSVCILDSKWPFPSTMSPRMIQFPRHRRILWLSAIPKKTEELSLDCS